MGLKIFVTKKCDNPIKT